MNTQEPLKKEVSSGRYVEVSNIFVTLQGEGPFAGKQALFIRLHGCNLQCPLCDTDYTSNRATYTAGKLAHLAKEFTRDFKYEKLVVITGGEPFRQNIGPLINEMLYLGLTVQVETNGTLPPPESLSIRHTSLVIVCSPKTGRINQRLLPYIHHFKYVMEADKYSITDGLPTTVLGLTPTVARPPEWFKGNIYLQPADTEQQERATKQVAQNCVKFGYILNIQIHKIAGLD